MRIAVTGASGRIGGQVMRLLAADRTRHVVALSRQPRPGALQAPNVSWAVVDYSDLDALRAALPGVDTLVFVSSDGPVAQVMVHHHNVIRAAADSDVAHVVALSGLDADLGSPFCYAVSYGYTEQLLSDSGCAVSIARASIYTEFFIGFLTQARKTSQLRVPTADGRISLVTRGDVSRCLAALAASAPTGRHHDITGPESLDSRTIAGLAEQEWGTSITHVDLTLADYSVELARAGEDAWWVYAYSTMFDSVREQRWARVSEEVSRLTGHSPTPIRDVLAAHTPN
jgi:NAD(P)H dehydrogenase (quinone)